MATWLPIPGFAGYKVSDEGRVMSFRRKAPRLLSGSLTKCGGYPAYSLTRDDGKQVTGMPAHRLVLLAFVGPLPTGMVTRHLDGNPLNNRLSNLVYGTQAQNNADKIVHGTVYARSAYCPQGHERSAQGRCRACNTEQQRAYRAARKAVAA